MPDDNGPLWANLELLREQIVTMQNGIAGVTGSAWKQLQQASLMGWAYGNQFQVVSATRDSNEAIITAQIVWPDGSLGVFTTDVASTAFPGAIDAWHATYIGSSGTKTITQAAVTRDISGAVTSQPAITIM